MPKIENLTSIQVLDSRGLPTISTEILLDDGTRSVSYTHLRAHDTSLFVGSVRCV